MYDDRPNLCPIGDAVSRWSNTDPVVSVIEGPEAYVITAGDECAPSPRRAAHWITIKREGHVRTVNTANSSSTYCEACCF